MTNEQAKQVLQLYRPGTADAADPAFAEALAACERDAELKQWFNNHCDLYAAIRAKFRKIPVPEALKEQIIAELPVNRTPAWQKAVVGAGALAMLVLAVMIIQPMLGTREPRDFGAYRSHMVSVAELAYQMDLFTNDLDSIRTFLSEKKAIADYVLPENLQKNAKPLGCFATTWQGKDVTMICFATGRPTDPSHPSDLWLFVSGNTIAKDAPKASEPTFAKSNDDLITATWTVGNRTYVLATRGDEQFLGKYLPGKVL